MVRWVVGSILRGLNTLSHFSFQPVLHEWCNKCRGMCYPVCGMIHIKKTLLLIGNSSPCSGDSGFPLLPSSFPTVFHYILRYYFLVPFAGIQKSFVVILYFISLVRRVELPVFFSQ